MIDKLKYKKKYMTMCIKYADLADRKVTELEEDRKILLQNIKYREEIENLKNELTKYKRKYGKLEGGDKCVKNKDKR